MSGIAIPFVSSGRCALLITDDYLCFYRVSGRQVSLVDMVPWRGPETEGRMAEILEREAGGSGIIILNDAVEQHYRKEKVPFITLLDKANVVQRRLNVAFPYYPVRAAMLLKSAKPVRAKADAPGGQDGELYLFAAVPPSDNFTKLLGAIEKSGVAVSSYGLLPVESSSLVKVLAENIAKQRHARDAAVWSVLISQHRGGGLRQIVTKNGELALTRVTPISEPDAADPATWAGDVSHEFQATLSYLSRFGYSPEEGLNVMVIGQRNAAEALQDLISVPCAFSAMSVRDAADLLGVRVASEDGDHYADCLHALWAARKVSFSLPLDSKELDRISKPRKIANLAMILLALGSSYFAYLISESAQSMYASSRNMEIAQQQKVKIEKIYDDEVKRKEAMGIDVPLIRGALGVSGALENKTQDPLALLEKVSRELQTLRIDGFEFNADPLPDPKVGAAGEPAPTPAAAGAIRSVNLLLKFSFAGTVKPQDGNKEIDDLKTRLGDALPGYRVSVKKPLEVLDFRGAVSNEIGVTAAARQASDRFTSEILIEKVQDVKDSGK